MYAIIYWLTDDMAYAFSNKNGTIMLFENIAEADKKAYKLETIKKVEARVISIESVKE